MYNKPSNLKKVAHPLVGIKSRPKLSKGNVLLEEHIDETTFIGAPLKLTRLR